jgi:hypothetical protein
MPSLYNGYCYSTLAEISDLILSDSTSYVQGSAFYPTASSVVLNTVVTTYNTKLSGQNPVLFGNVSRSFPGCASVGPVVNLTGLSVTDVVDMSFLVILVWVVAFSFKSMKRVIR